MRYIAVTNGCFDCFHAGHLSLLQFCKSYKHPDYTHLIVLLDTDRKIKLDKGIYRPYFSFDERVKILNQTGLVDNIIGFGDNFELEGWIKGVCADIIFKGEDWKNKEVVGSKYVKEVVFVPHKISISTSLIEERLKWQKEFF